jgi:hypothetical protein
MNMTVAQLLKYKKRLVGRIATVTADITKNNSLLEKKQREVDVVELLKLRDKLVDHLVAVKMVLYKANATIQEGIFLLAELKGEVAMYSAINITHGPVEPGYGQKEGNVYVAAIRKADVDKKVEELNKKIDEVQQTLDGFNHSFKVDVPDFKE